MKKIHLTAAVYFKHTYYSEIARSAERADNDRILPGRVF